MEPYWISWYHHPDDGPFELRTPWWISGFTLDKPRRDTIVAAVQADSVEAAWEVIHQAYDTPPTRIQTRFCAPLGDQPVFGARFTRADWMEWPA